MTSSSAWAAPTVSLVGAGAPSRAVSLLAQKDGSLAGSTRLVLHNGTAGPVTTSAEYYADTVSRPLTVNAGSDPVALSAATIAASGTAVLTLRAHLSSSDVPSDLDGTLVIQERNARGRSVGSLTLALTGVVTLPTDVVFEPSTVTLQVTSGLLYSTKGDRETIRLRGPGVSRLLAELGHRTTSTRVKASETLLLADTDGNQTLVELLHPTKISPDLAEITVATQAVGVCKTLKRAKVECAEGAPRPGSYMGSLTLTPGESGGPTLDVTVDSRWPIWLAVVLVVVGALVGGLLPFLTGSARTRSQLRQGLRESLRDYEEAQQDPDAKATWDLDPYLGERQNWFPRRGINSPRARGAVGPVWARIRGDISQEDLAADATVVQTITGQVSSWLMVEPGAAALAKLGRTPPPDREKHPWGNTEIAKNTGTLLSEVCNKPTPVDIDTAQKLKIRLDRQIRLHKAYADAWVRFTALARDISVEQTERYADLWTQADIDTFDAAVTASPESSRDDNGQAQLENQLTKIAESIELLLAALGVADEDPAADPPSVEPLGEAEKKEAAKRLRSSNASPSEVAKEMDVSRVAVEAVKSELSQGVAALPAANLQPAVSGTQKGSGAEGSGARPLIRRLPGWLRHPVLEVSDVLASAVIGLGTVIAYILPLYTSTWGGVQDAVLAIAAGAGGQVVVQWAVLPVFRSKHLPTSSSPGSGS
jgi:hypothetical protein